jgi:hypothetical protein
VKRLIQIAVIVVIAFLIWKKGVPWWQEHHGSSSASSSSSANSSCVELAEHASEVWGSGIGRFANPPYDLGAWGEFRSRIDAAIAKADSLCNCGDDSCTKSKQAMGDLRTLVSEMDGSIRGGTEPPGDVVQRQEQIDNTINAARDSLRGK